MTIQSAPGNRPAALEVRSPYPPSSEFQTNSIFVAVNPHDLTDQQAAVVVFLLLAIVYLLPLITCAIQLHIHVILAPIIPVPFLSIIILRYGWNEHWIYRGIMALINLTSISVLAGQQANVLENDPTIQWPLYLLHCIIMVSAFSDVFYSLGQVFNRQCENSREFNITLFLLQVISLGGNSCGIVSTALLLHAKDLNQTSQNFSSMHLQWLYVSMSLIGNLLDYLIAIWWCWTKLRDWWVNTGRRIFLEVWKATVKRLKKVSQKSWEFIVSRCKELKSGSGRCFTFFVVCLTKLLQLCKGEGAASEDRAQAGAPGGSAATDEV